MITQLSTWLYWRCTIWRPFRSWDMLVFAITVTHCKCLVADASTSGSCPSSLQPILISAVRICVVLWLITTIRTPFICARSELLCFTVIALPSCRAVTKTSIIVAISNIVTVVLALLASSWSGLPGDRSLAIKLAAPTPFCHLTPPSYDSPLALCTSTGRIVEVLRGNRLRQSAVTNDFLH